MTPAVLLAAWASLAWAGMSGSAAGGGESFAVASRSAIYVISHPPERPGWFSARRLGFGGETLWIDTFGQGRSAIRAAVVDDRGGLVVAGEAGGDSLVARYDPYGRREWARGLDGRNENSAVYAAVDPQGASFVVSGALINGGVDTVLTKLSPSGEILWRYAFDSGDNDYPRGLTLDVEGEVALLVVETRRPSGFLRQHVWVDAAGRRVGR